MKNKEIKAYIGFLRVVLVFSALCLVLSALTFSAFASDDAQKNEIIVENYNLTEKYSLMLSEDANKYSELDVTAHKTVSKSVLNVINRYRKELLDLQSHPEVSTRPLTKEADLIYVKGYVAGKVSWIYYYNLPSLKNADSVAEAKSVYEGFIKQINESMGSGAIDPSGDPFCAELNTVMYKKMICELEREDELLSGKSVISSGCDRLDLLDSPDLMGKEHLAVYESTVKELHLQRSKDFLTSELEDIFKIMYPNGDISENPIASRFTYRIRNSTTVQETNAVMQEALNGLLTTPESKKYSFLFTSSLKESITQTIATYTKENAPADVISLFASYPLESARAAAKDEINQLIYSGGSFGDAELKRLEGLFNSTGGILDGASSLSEIQSEILRANFIKQCYTELCSVNEEIEIVLEPYDPPRFSERSRAVYNSAIEAVLKTGLSPTFESNCQTTLAGLKESLRGILNESKAERFLLDHKKIISKPSDQLTPADELALRYAITDYTKLEPEVCLALTGQINSIAEKYNNVLSQIIRAKLANDALYLDICEVFCVELKELPKNNIEDFYNNCDLVLKKSDALCKVINEYRDVVLSDLYQSYTASERESLVLICRQNAEELHKLDINDKTLFEDDLTSLTEDAKLDLARTNETVRIRVAARGSENMQIKSLIAEANAKIKASYNKSEMVSTADKTIFKINRFLTADAIDLQAETQKYAIDSMKFLTSDEKDLFKSRINTLQSDSKNDAMLSENLTVLQFIWDSFSESSDKISSEAESKDLERSREAHLELLKKEYESFISDVRSMVYLSAKQSEEFLNKGANLQAAFKSDIVSAQKSAEIETLYSKTLDTLHSLSLSASHENLSNYKKFLLGQTDAYKNTKDKYSAENYNKILDILSDLEQDLSVAGSISACDGLMQNTLSRIELINDLLDDAKQNSIKTLEEKVALYKKSSQLYSSAAMASIDSLLSDAKREISAYTSHSEIADVNAALTTYLERLSAIKRDYISSAENGLGFLAQGTLYPLHHDFSNGYWGLIHLPDALPSDVSLSLLPGQNNDLDSIEKLIKSAIADNKVKFYGETPSEAELRLIKNATAKLGIDISLSDGFSPAAPFTLQMLLPSSLEDENVLGIVFVDDNGNVEFYSVEQRDMLVSTTLNHLSDYYIIVEKTTDLGWLIVLLTILVLIELLIFAAIALLRHRRKRKENNMFPLISSCFINPLSVSALARIRPDGAVTTTVLLSVAVLAVGCAIALLARTELKDRKRAASGEAVGSADIKRKSARRDDRRLEGVVRRPLLRAKSLELEAPKQEDSRFSDEIYYTSDSGEENIKEDATVLCAVSVGESSAESKSFDAGIPSDDDIELIDHEDESESYSYLGRAKHKAEINLDVIAQKFSDGDLVTLDGLKRKRLVPKKTDYVKILARGALSKPLIIEAHDFSRAAEEILTAVGGEAIRIRK